ncbi:MAG: prenyltransferase/squalene oxidase repeat-containing protein, partial [Planctomycetota bacterium]
EAERKRKIAGLVAKAREDVRAFRFLEARGVIEDALKLVREDEEDEKKKRGELKALAADYAARGKEYARLSRLRPPRPAAREPTGDADLDFGLALLQRFGFTDLAERHFEKLARSIGESKRQSAALGIALVRKSQADAALREGRSGDATRLYDDATERLRRFLDRARRTHLGRELAQDEVDELLLARLVHARTAALAEPGPRNGRKTLGGPGPGWTARMRDAAHRERKLFEDAYEDSERVGQKLCISRLHEAIRAMRRHLDALLWCARVAPPGSEERRRAARLILEHAAEQRDFYEKREFGLVALRLDLVIGRTHAMLGDLDKAEEDLDLITQQAIDRLPRNIREWVDDLRMAAFVLKAEAAYEAGKYERCVSAVDEMFTPLVGFVQGLDDHRGNFAALLKAEATMRTKTPDRDEAMYECRRVIRRGLGRWPALAREAMAWIEDGTPARERIAEPPGAEEEEAVRGMPEGDIPWQWHGNLGIGSGPWRCRYHGLRSGGGRRKAALRLGGSTRSEAAVDAALRWLVKNQKPGGGWREDGAADADVGLTGLSLLAFLGAGHTEKTGRYKASVVRAARCLVGRQDEDGRIGRGGVDHAIAGLALSEAYGMARVRTTGAAAQKAITYAMQKLDQKPRLGRPLPTGPLRRPSEAPLVVDVLATAWFVMQARSAHGAGLRI